MQYGLIVRKMAVVVFFLAAVLSRAQDIHYVAPNPA